MNINFKAFSLTQPGIEPESTVSVADAQSTQPLTNNRVNRASATETVGISLTLSRVKSKTKQLLLSC